IGILPGVYALNTGSDSPQFEGAAAMATSLQPAFQTRAEGAAVSVANRVLSEFLKSSGKANTHTFAASAATNRGLADELRAHDRTDRRSMRTDIYFVAKTIRNLASMGQFRNADEQRAATDYRIRLESLVNFIPLWVKSVVAFTLGLGTMIGWKR